MLRLISILSFAILACLTVFTVAHAQNAAPAIPPPPLQCINTAGTVRIEAMTDAAGGFPVPVSCPTNPFGVSECLKWSYKYTLLSGNNISVSAITVDSDVDIVAATSGSPETGPNMKVYDVGSTDSSIAGIGAGIFDFRTVKFTSQGAVVLGHIYTKTNVAVGSVTAISKVGNAGATTCQIAGADNIAGGISVGRAPVTTIQVDQFEQCNIVLTVDSKGCPTGAEATSNTPDVTCTVTELPFSSVNINGQPFAGGVCGNRFVSGTNTCVWYCPTSTGKCFQICK